MGQFAKRIKTAILNEPPNSFGKTKFHLATYGKKLARAIIPRINRVVKSSKGKLTRRIDDQAFNELGRISLDEFFSKISTKRKMFICRECAIEFRDLQQNDNVTWLGDDGIIDRETLQKRNSIFCAGCRYLDNISVDDAEDMGFILHARIRNDQAFSPKVRPLIINCYGVGTSSTIRQAMEAVKNGFGVLTETVRHIDKMIKEFIKDEQKQNNNDTYIIPYITGHSLGGMFAAVISSKQGIGSCLFNPWGAGAGICEYIGQSDWERANNNSTKHISFSAEYDYASSDELPFKQLVKIPGQIISYKSEEFVDDGIHPRRAHNDYSKFFQRMAF